ncbi:ATP-binding protein [uncultured Sphingomonas sp.]|uniref:ATP-binding protein n=1 Tax=uncultured Sphingomonas sp. TaxID=158754 RepID=UPI00338DAA17
MNDVDSAVARGGLVSAWRTITLSVMALAGAVVLAALVITLGEANRQRDRALAAQRHSYDVMILARTLQGTIGRSEASLGRYVVSGDQQLGRLYFEDWRRAGETINRLEKLAGDNPTQRVHLADLRAAFQQRGGELAATALETNYRRNDQALSRYWQLRQTESLEAINAALTGLIADERMLLEARTSQALASVRRSTTIAKVLAVFGVLLVLGAIAMGWIMVRALADRAIARAEADEERERADELAAAVEQATAELRAQEARLRQVQKMEAVGQLTGGIAHDFNNMLAVVLGGLELAQRHLLRDPAQAARHLDSAHEGAHRAAALTSRLLAFARETAINPEPICADALFSGLSDLLSRTLGDGITVTFHDDSQGWCTRADRVQLENVIVNLAVNARDAMEGRGTLSIAARCASFAAAHGPRQPGDYLAISVADTGCGIPPEVIERVFEPFFTTKAVGKGTGLGLSQIFAFTQAVGGEVSIESSPGRGTTVSLLLPRDAAGVSAPSIAPPALAPVPAAPDMVDVPAPSELAILVVEDDPRVLSATMGALRELGHHPVECNDAAHAGDMLATMRHVDLIVSDVLMPSLTGPEMVAGLPAAYAGVPVLFVTGFAGEAGGGIDLGGRPVLRKPFTLAALDRAVRGATAGSGTIEPIAAE